MRAVLLCSLPYLDVLACQKLFGFLHGMLAASIFHYGQHTVQEAKQFLASQNIKVRQ